MMFDSQHFETIHGTAARWRRRNRLQTRSVIAFAGMCAVAASVVALAGGRAAGEDASVPWKSKRFSQWVGKWEVSTKFNRRLGFDDQNGRGDNHWDHPTSFSLTIDERFGQSISPEAAREYEEMVFNRMKHRVVATGQWKTKFEVEPGIETGCFITEADGATFLWVPAPFVVLYGGRVSFLQGAERKDDVLVIDLDATEKHLRGETRSSSTFGYKRAIERKLKRKSKLKKRVDAEDAKSRSDD